MVLGPGMGVSWQIGEPAVAGPAFTTPLFTDQYDAFPVLDPDLPRFNSRDPQPLPGAEPCIGIRWQQMLAAELGDSAAELAEAQSFDPLAQDEMEEIFDVFSYENISFRGFAETELLPFITNANTREIKRALYETIRPAFALITRIIACGRHAEVFATMRRGSMRNLNGFEYLLNRTMGLPGTFANTLNKLEAVRREDVSDEERSSIVHEWAAIDQKIRKIVFLGPLHRYMGVNGLTHCHGTWDERTRRRTGVSATIFMCFGVWNYLLLATLERLAGAQLPTIRVTNDLGVTRALVDLAQTLFHELAGHAFLHLQNRESINSPYLGDDVYNEAGFSVEASFFGGSGSCVDFPNAWHHGSFHLKYEEVPFLDGHGDNKFLDSFGQMDQRVRGFPRRWRVLRRDVTEEWFLPDSYVRRMLSDRYWTAPETEALQRPSWPTWLLASWQTRFEGYRFIIAPSASAGEPTRFRAECENHPRLLRQVDGGLGSQWIEWWSASMEHAWIGARARSREQMGERVGWDEGTIMEDVQEELDRARREVQEAKTNTTANQLNGLGISTVDVEDGDLSDVDSLDGLLYFDGE